MPDLQRIAGTAAAESFTADSPLFFTTHYSYDIHGNVDTLVQDYGSYAVGTYRNIMNANGLHNRLKKTVYQYDLISGKVNHVAFQPQYRKGANIYIAADAMYHKYEYDAENRLIAVHTSTDSVVWERDAAYAYYKHGPLARTELGEQRVQGLDYAYTIQGWLKGVNSSSLDSSVDMGLDGFAGLSATPVPKDEFGFSLNYFNGDYSSIKEGVGSTAFPEHTQAAGISNGLATAAYQPLYNGNISSMAVNIGKLSVPDATGTGTTQGAVLYNYGYDQLNRLVSMDAYKGLNNSNNSWENMVSLPHYQERVAYDGNGNILKYKRNGNKTSQQVMDSLNYVYTYHTSGVLNGKLKHNQLKQVIDGVTNTAAYDESDPASGVSDIESQAANNYAYDSIGNLIKDTKENINSINWNVYGKISDINFAFVANKIKKITYGYDAAGNRISKMVEKYGASGTATATSDYTWYSRDASGNVMGVYTSTGSGTTLPSSVNVTERHLYGSRRLGILSETKDAKPLKTQSSSLAYLSTFIRGNKVFELSNHLGNVLATVSDKKKGIDNGVYELSCFPGFGCNLVQVSTDPDGQVDYYVADVVSANDYYPFGMMQPGRIYSATNGYRYGFNGKENDNEVKGGGNQQFYGFRTYDARLGKFLSTDPFNRQFPGSTPYSFAGNSPTGLVDFEGGFRISSWFVKRYPTLAKMLELMAGSLKRNTKVRDAWISALQIKDQAVGEKLWDEMLTYGSGPWVTPDRPNSEDNGYPSPQFNIGHNGLFTGVFSDNVLIKRSNIAAVEAALSQSDARETSFQMFKVFTLIIHESGHWARFHAGLQGREDYKVEDGARAEDAVFGERFQYTNPMSADLNRQTFNEKNARRYFNKDYNLRGGEGNTAILVPMLPICLDINRVKKMRTPSGEKGDPTLIENGDEKPSPKTRRVFTSPERQKKQGDFTYDY